LAADDTFAKRIRESTDLFRSIGETLFGRPLRVEVRISGEVADCRQRKGEPNVTGSANAPLQIPGSQAFHRT
jgi:hypothetical protein